MTGHISEVLDRLLYGPKKEPYGSWQDNLDDFQWLIQNADSVEVRFPEELLEKDQLSNSGYEVWQYTDQIVKDLQEGRGLEDSEFEVEHRSRWNYHYLKLTGYTDEGNFEYELSFSIRK